MTAASFGQVLRTIRREQRVSQLSLALAAGCTDAGYLCRLERGWRRNPSAQFLGRLLAGFAALERPLSPAQQRRLISAALAIEQLFEAG